MMTGALPFGPLQTLVSDLVSVCSPVVVFRGVLSVKGGWFQHFSFDFRGFLVSEAFLVGL